MDFIEGQKKSNVFIFYTFWQFSHEWCYTFSLLFAHSFLGMILINCKEMDFIELFERSFSSQKGHVLSIFR